MASCPLSHPDPFPSSHSPHRDSFESQGSGGLLNDASPPHSAAVVLADSAPIYPLNGDEDEQGFGRADLYRGSLVDFVQMYERHVFLCYKEPHSWPPQVEAAEFDRLPRYLAAILKTRKNDMPKKTRLTICEGRDGTDSSNGDVMVFPDMVRYRGLTHFDVDAFADEVLVHEREWLSGKPERLVGTHVFVCCHARRDARCGVCGPGVIRKFKEEISVRGLEGHVFVRPCSHIGGHKYVGNVIIYSSNTAGEVAGHWYGYVTPDNVQTLLDDYIRKGNIIERSWSCEMGLVENEQKQVQHNSLQPLDRVFSFENMENNGCLSNSCQAQANGHANGKFSLGLGDCCEKTEEHCVKATTRRKKERSENINENGRVRHSGSGSWWCQISSWFEAWEREDTLATLAVIGAAASVAVAYHLYKNS